MASALLELRRAAGFRSAKAFSEEMGIPLPTYSRYESQPNKIPLPAAWKLADRLGCSIDLVVGRSELVGGAEADADVRGPVQRLHDDLSPALKEAHSEYLSFLVAKNTDAKRRRADEARRRAERLCESLERAYLARVEERGDALEVLADPARLRDGFGEYVAERLSATGAEGEGAQKAREALMATYDGLHPATSGARLVVDPSADPEERERELELNAALVRALDGREA